MLDDITRWVKIGAAYDINLPPILEDKKISKYKAFKQFIIYLTNISSKVKSESDNIKWNIDWNLRWCTKYINVKKLQNATYDSVNNNTTRDDNDE